MTSPKLLALFNHDRTSDEVASKIVDLKKSLLSFTSVEFDVVDSHTWFQSHFARCGGWDSWVWETVVGKDYNTRETFFRGFVVCDEPLGKANRGIVELALKNQRLVLLYREQAPFQRVTAATQTEIFAEAIGS